MSLGFRDGVLTALRTVPPGRVTTYGRLALVAGAPRAARLVAAVLRAAGDEAPWHRVVNAHGRISTYRLGFGELQRALLEAEGVEFGADGAIDLRRYGWEP